MAGRRIKNEADARVCLAAERAAGGDACGWARARGVDGRSLNAWRLNLGRRRSRPKTRPALVELVAAPAPRVGDAQYALVLGNARIEFGDACSADTLRRVLQALG